MEELKSAIRRALQYQPVMSFSDLMQAIDYPEPDRVLECLWVLMDAEEIFYNPIAQSIVKNLKKSKNPNG